jgi:hypothetical protein
MNLFRDWAYAVAGHLVRDVPFIVEVTTHPELSMYDFLLGDHDWVLTINPNRGERYIGKMGYHRTDKSIYSPIITETISGMNPYALVLMDFEALYPLSPIFKIARDALMVVICYDPVYDDQICAVKRESGKNWMVGGAGRTTVAVGR